MQIISSKQCVFSGVLAELAGGATMVYPTETCYGLGCDATNTAAIEKLYKIKGRPEGKPFIVIVASLEMMASYIEISPLLLEIEKKYWPGALTVVCDVTTSNYLPPGVVGEDETIAFRVSSNGFARELSKTLGRPIVSTSANLAGEPNVYSAEEALSIFSGREFQPDILVDAGELPRVPPSTVIRVIGNKIEVIREGEVKII